MPDKCGDSERMYYDAGYCNKTGGVEHSTDRFCITGRRKPRDEIKPLMQASEPSGYKRNGKYVSN